MRKREEAHESKMEGMAETVRARMSPPSSEIEHVMYGGGGQKAKKKEEHASGSGSKGPERYDISDGGSRGRGPHRNGGIKEFTRPEHPVVGFLNNVRSQLVM